VLKKGVESEEAAIAQLNERMAVLDRAVDAYTREGGRRLLKLEDGIRKGQDLLARQAPERFRVIDAARDESRVQADIRSVVEPFWRQQPEKSNG
jgi:thymidylate kinase